MAGKYYYLKLKDDFFEQEEIVVLESMPDGYLYSNILLKLYLKSLQYDGRLMYRGVIPYTPEVLATITRHNVGTIEKAIKTFQKLGLIEILDNGAMYMLDVQNFVGHSSTEADRKRQYRAKIEMERIGQMSGQMSHREISWESKAEGDFGTFVPQRIENREQRIENREDIIYNVRKDITLTVPPKAKHSASISQIVDYLNQKSGKTFRATTKATQSLIKARLKEGFTVDDFMKVIDIKVQKWNTDPKMQDYIRPATLFGTKFESYLNEFSVENPAAEVQLEDTNMPQWAIEDRRKQERIKNNIERMPSEVREKFEKDKEEFTRIVQKNLQNITYAHMDDFEPEELTEAETAFYEEHKKFIEQLETEDITWKK